MISYILSARALHILRSAGGIISYWIGKDGCEPRRLLGSQLRHVLAEVVAGGSLDTEQAITPFDAIQVELDDSPLGEISL